MNIDKRMLRTEDNIQKSLMQLLTYKSYHKITITEVAKLAGIGRKTFYLHYDSIDDVLVQIEEQLQDDLDVKLEQETNLSVQKLLKILNDLMLKNQSFYKGILISSPNVFLNDDFQLILQRCLKKYIANSSLLKNKQDKVYYASFLAAGIVQCYREHLEKKNEPIEVLSNTLSRILMKFD